MVEFIGIVKSAKDVLNNLGSIAKTVKGVHCQTIPARVFPRRRDLQSRGKNIVNFSKRLPLRFRTTNYSNDIRLFWF